MDYKTSNSKKRAGFTLVEITVVVFVLAILAAIGVVSYNGYQRRSVVTVLEKDLSLALDEIDIADTVDGAIPENLLDDFKTTEGVTVTFDSTEVDHYSGLSAVQNGVLFFNMCNSLIAEGFAVGQNNGGQTEQYISACNVYNNPELQVNSAWNARNFNVPVTDSTLTNLADSLDYSSDTWRPNRTAIEQEFYNTWHTRFMAQGGYYPITTFWDPWANQWAGIPKEDLPEPDANSLSIFCVQATHDKFPNMPYIITNTNKEPSPGSC